MNKSNPLHRTQTVLAEVSIELIQVAAVAVAWAEKIDREKDAQR